MSNILNINYCLLIHLFKEHKNVKTFCNFADRFFNYLSKIYFEAKHLEKGTE